MSRRGGIGPQGRSSLERDRAAEGRRRDPDAANAPVGRIDGRNSKPAGGSQPAITAAAEWARSQWPMGGGQAPEFPGVNMPSSGGVRQPSRYYPPSDVPPPTGPPTPAGPPSGPPSPPGGVQRPPRHAPPPPQPPAGPPTGNQQPPQPGSSRQPRSSSGSPIIDFADAMVGAPNDNGDLDHRETMYKSTRNFLENKWGPNAPAIYAIGKGLVWGSKRFGPIKSPENLAVHYGGTSLDPGRVQTRHASMIPTRPMTGFQSMAYAQFNESDFEQRESAPPPVYREERTVNGAPAPMYGGTGGGGVSPLERVAQQQYQDPLHEMKTGNPWGFDPHTRSTAGYDTPGTTPIPGISARRRPE